MLSRKLSSVAAMLQESHEIHLCIIRCNPRRYANLDQGYVIAASIMVFTNKCATKAILLPTNKEANKTAVTRAKHIGDLFCAVFAKIWLVRSRRLGSLLDRPGHVAPNVGHDCVLVARVL